MIRALVVLVSVIAVNAAPALVQQQYLFISPEAQLQLQPALKLQQPILQPIAQLKLPDLATKNEVLIYYPNAPLVQYPLVGVRQNWIDQITNIFTQWTQGGGDGDSGNDDSMSEGETPDATVKIAQPPSNSDAEIIPATKTPAATIPLAAVPAGNPYFILSEQPRFYGNFGGLRHIQPTVLIKARSVQDQQVVQEQSVAEQAAEPLLKVAEPVEIQAADTATKNVEADVVSARFQSEFPAVLNQNEPDSASLEGKAQNLKALSESDPEKPESSDKASEDPSLARAGPVGVALAGKNGLAASNPFGTALVGSGGIALASPQGTSIAGDFLGGSDKQ